MRKVLLIGIITCCYSMYVFGGNDVRIEPQNGIYRMWCPFTVTMKYNTQDNTMLPSNFEIRTLYGGTGVLNPSTFVWGSVVDAGNSTYTLTPNLYLNGVLVGGNPQFGNIATFRLTSKNVSSGHVSFLTGITSDQGLRGNSGTPLPGVRYIGADYMFQPIPCTDDTQAPGFANFVPNITGTTKIQHTSGLRFSVQEPNGPRSAGFLTDPADFTNIANFLDTYTGNNQWGVNLDTLQVTLRRTIPSPTFITQVYGPNKNNAGSRNVQAIASGGLTWNRNQRNYDMRMTNIPPTFGIEKEMKLDLLVQDNAGNQFAQTYTFNSPRVPWLTDKTLEGAIEVLPLTDIRHIVRDDRAGVQSGTMEVRVYNQSSGNELVGYFTGAPAILAPLRAVDVSGEANTPDQSIHIRSGEMYLGVPFEFPIPTDVLAPGNTIRVEVAAYDNEMNLGGGTYNFVTRRACGAYPGCSDPLRIYMSGGATYGHLYTYDTLYITGAQLPYPYVDSGRMYCGPTQTDMFYGSQITGDIVNPQLYTQENLYIQGGTVQLSGDELIITPF